jgi:hypothetical protein
MKPPTQQEVIDYVEEKRLCIDPIFFWNWFNENEWHDANDKPVKRWKGKALQWHYHEAVKLQAIKCVTCGKQGYYFGGKDDTGQTYYYCEDHKKPWKSYLPKELTQNIGNIETKVIDLNDRRNEQIRRLKA